MNSAMPCGCDDGAGWFCELHAPTSGRFSGRFSGSGSCTPPTQVEPKHGATQRKQHPMASGVLDYFPDALWEVANVSYVGNEQHNPGQPLHWDRAKSTDEADALLRHLKDRGTFDTDGCRHTAKVAWRALALLQKEIEASR